MRIEYNAHRRWCYLINHDVSSKSHIIPIAMVASVPEKMHGAYIFSSFV